ncbi:MAG TPA: CoA-transferase [Pseudorhodoplanes sp.]|nr:CoA-transferase [Pseudorhodoplanes sp.]
MSEQTDTVRLVALAAREIRDHEVCFVGIGVPSLAAMAAKRTHAPNAVLIYESGAIDADPPKPPLSTGSPAVVANTAMIGSCLSVFALLQQGRIDRGLLSAAQVDREGNLNSTALHRSGRPDLRLVGSGGAHDIALLAREVLIIMPQDKRRFVERVDYVTSPGTRAPRLSGRQGPTALITSHARFSFDRGELTLDAVADGVSSAEARACLTWRPPEVAPLRTLAPIDRELAAVAETLIHAWGRDIG